jgi:serralysin
MTTRLALTAEKPAIVTDYAFCMCALCQQVSDAAVGGKLLSEIAFNPADLSAVARAAVAAGDVTVLAPPTIGDAVFPLVSDTIQSSNDADFFAVNLVAGRTYTFSLRGTGSPPLSDPLLALFTDPEGDGFTLAAIDDDGGDGLNSLLTITATYSGTHILGVQATGAAFSGDYTLYAIPKDAADEPDTIAGATSLTVGNLYYGFIDFVPNVGARPYGRDFGEVDTFKINVEAGKAYTVEVSGGGDYLSDFRNLPPGEVDTFVVIYREDGSIVATNDDASFSNGDIGSGLSFVADANATYYIDVFAYAPQTGGYSIVAQEYDLSTADPLESLYWDSADNVIPGRDNVVKVYFAKPDENFGEVADNGTDPLESFGWNAWEKQQIFEALAEYTKILGINYVETDNVREADFRLITTTSEQFGAYFYPQDQIFGQAQGIGAFNVDSGGWNFDQQQSLVQGGFAFAVILHEFGHAHGLAHPHDNGGGSEILGGVFGPFDSYGFFDLNQGVYTVMSYNDAWPLHPDGPSPFTAAGIDNGWSGTLSAFDIAALQSRYGVHPDFATGNDVYALRDEAEQGTFYQCIYDTGGTDQIIYSGRNDARIDLTAATLDYSPTGGGVLSFVDTVKGGYTIANGVVIENATGGSGNDVLIGNAAANVLRGNNGADKLFGRDGADQLDGGGGNDLLDGGAGADTMTGGKGGDTFVVDGSDILTDFKSGEDNIQLAAAGISSFSWIGSNAFSGTAGELRAYKSGTFSYLAGDMDGDGRADFLVRTHDLVGKADLIFDDAGTDLANGLGRNGGFDFVRPSELLAIQDNMVFA